MLAYREDVLRTCEDARLIQQLGITESGCVLRMDVLGNVALGLVGESLELFLAASSYITPDISDSNLLPEDINDEMGDVLFYCELGAICLEDTIDYSSIESRLSNRYGSLLHVNGLPLFSKEGYCRSPKNADAIERAGFSHLFNHAMGFSERYKKCRYKGIDLDKIFVDELSAHIKGAISAIALLGQAWLMPIRYTLERNMMKRQKRYPNGDPSRTKEV